MAELDPWSTNRISRRARTIDHVRAPRGIDAGAQFVHTIVRSVGGIRLVFKPAFHRETTATTLAGRKQLKRTPPAFIHTELRRVSMGE